MSNLKIGRYSHESVSSEYAGYIEPDDKSWIIWLGADGKPALYFAEREPGGAVVGLGVHLNGDVSAG